MKYVEQTRKLLQEMDDTSRWITCVKCGQPLHQVEAVTETINGKPERVHKKCPIQERKLTQAELDKREEIAKAIEREHPGMDMSKKMAIATATAKRVAEEEGVKTGGITEQNQPNVDPEVMNQLTGPAARKRFKQMFMPWFHQGRKSDVGNDKS